MSLLHHPGRWNLCAFFVDLAHAISIACAGRWKYHFASTTFSSAAWPTQIWRLFVGFGSYASVFGEIQYFSSSVNLDGLKTLTKFD